MGYTGINAVPNMLYYQRIILYESKNGTTILLYYSHVGVIIVFNDILINTFIASKCYVVFDTLYITKTIYL